MVTPHYADDWLTVYAGDVRDVLPELASDSVDCIVTSPPYWGLRDYGTEGQLGLEATPEEYVANLVAVFRELRRVLKPSGTCWLNLGDSYSQGAMTGAQGPNGITGSRAQNTMSVPPRALPAGLKPKDLVGIPWRVAFALQADGWYLRSDIIWSKPNPMPESVTDRPTKAHEYLFLLSKSPRYYFDQEAVREGVSNGTHGGQWTEGGHKQTALGQQVGGRLGNSPETGNRNLRSVWTIATRPYPGAHFAVFPPELPERCIKAGSSERGVCPECGAPWERVVERDTVLTRPGKVSKLGTTEQERRDQGRDTTVGLQFRPETSVTTTGWLATCGHPVKCIPATILDPFAGSGTVGLVANRLSRRAILIDLNPAYLDQQMKRNAQVPVGL